MPALVVPLIVIMGIVGLYAQGDTFKSVVSFLTDPLSSPPSSSAPSSPSPSAPKPKQTSIKKAPTPTPKQTLTKSQQSTPVPPPVAPLTPLAAPPIPVKIVSPYFEKLRISTFQPPAGFRHAQAVLRTNFSQEKTINITGWTLHSKWAGVFKIPFGIEKYHPVFNGQSTEPILVKPGDTVYIAGLKSPLGIGRNFRPNQCFGYLKSSATGPLPGPSSCSQDKPRLEQISNFSPLCQEFILKRIDYSACKFPDKGIISDPDCVSFLTTLSGSLSYESCYQKRSPEQNFTLKEWYIYINGDFGNIYHDTITLLDQDGLLVDKYIY